MATKQTENIKKTYRQFLCWFASFILIEVAQKCKAVYKNIVEIRAFIKCLDTLTFFQEMLIPIGSRLALKAQSKKKIRDLVDHK